MWIIWIQTSVSIKLFFLIQPCLFDYISPVSMAAFALQQQCWIFATETSGLKSLKYLPSGPLQKMCTTSWSKAVCPKFPGAWKLPGDPAKIQIKFQEIQSKAQQSTCLTGSQMMPQLVVSRTHLYLPRVFKRGKKEWCFGHSSVAEHMFDMPMALGSIPSIPPPQACSRGGEAIKYFEAEIGFFSFTSKARIRWVPV